MLTQNYKTGSQCPLNICDEYFCDGIPVDFCQSVGLLIKLYQSSLIQRKKHIFHPRDPQDGFFLKPITNHQQRIVISVTIVNKSNGTAEKKTVILPNIQNLAPIVLI